MNTADTQDPTFPDPMDFDLERQKLQRRRKIAEEMIATESQPRMMGNWVLNTGPMGGVAAAIGRGLGQYENTNIDDQEKLLGANEARTTRRLIEGIPAYDPDVPGSEVAREQALLNVANQAPSLRNLISAQIAGDERSRLAEANRIDKGEQLAADRVEKAEQAELNRGARSDLAFESNKLRLDLANNSNNLRRDIADLLAGKETAADKKLTAEKEVKVADAKEVLTLADQAALLVPNATGSGIGAAYDKLAGFIGQSTEGADNAAKLAALGGALISKMPKMTGPQSDKDVMLYKQMAGRIGDPEVPRSQKLAALETIREINSRHAGVPYTPRGVQSAAPVRVTTPEEAMALPSGTKYIRPDGKIGVRK